ncbi:MAG: ADP-ribosylglycohydrolase family protein [Candidatus Brocadiales bacterium]|nr:ADP-ribosylglycohydrolase family protein [Candidatus Brocadiales bacterium]
MLDTLSRIKGSIKLAAIVDALGFITEFSKTPEALETKSGVKKIDKFHKWKNVQGRWGGLLEYSLPGTYSDDTQLTLAVARSIQENGSIDQEYFAKKELVTWWHYKGGAGYTISAAAQKITRKSAKWNSNFYTYKRSNGTDRDYRDCAANGCAMRIAPIALVQANDYDKMRESIFGNAIVTHGHPRALAGAILYGYALHKILKTAPEDFTPDQLLSDISSNIGKILQLPFLSHNNFQVWVTKWNADGRDFSQEYDDTVEEVRAHLKIVSDNISIGGSIQDLYNKMGSYKKPSKSNGTNTVITALYVLCKYHNDPEAGIIDTVNMLGSDTDTIGAIAGGMLGGLHGEEIIPEKWKAVQDYKYLEVVGNRLSEIAAGTFSPPIPPAASGTCFNPGTDDFTLLSVNDRVTIDPLGDGRIIDITTREAKFKDRDKMHVRIKFTEGQTCTFSKFVPC